MSNGTLSYQHNARKSNILIIESIFISLIVIIIYMFLSVLKIDFYTKMDVYGMESIFVIIWIVISQIKLIRDFDIFTIMAILAGPFYYGHHYLHLIGGDIPSDSAFKLINNEINEWASNFVLLVLLVMYIGYLFHYTKKGRYQCSSGKEDSLDIDNISNNRLFRMMGICMLLLTIVPTLYYRIYEIGLNMTYGYIVANRMRANLGGMAYIGAFLSDWFISAIYILLITNSKKGIGRTFFSILAVIYCVLYLAGGSRFAVIEVIIGILLIRHVWVQRIKAKQMVVVFLGGMGIMILFSVLKDVRLAIATASSVAELFKSSAQSVLDSGPLANILEETGVTYSTIANILDKCPSVVPFSYGFSILGFVMLCFPGVLRFGLELKNFSVSEVFSKHMYGASMVGGYGSSFVAEFYYNFGYFAFIAFYLFGKFLGVLSNKLSKYAAQKKADAFFVLIYICSRTVFLIRTDVVSMGRYCLYFAILPIFVYRVLNQKSK